jgi:hypothetical protein
MQTFLRSRLRATVAFGAALLLSGFGVVATAPAANAVGYGPHQPLVVWYHWGRQDNFTAWSQTQNDSAYAAEYEIVRYEEAWLPVFASSNTGSQRELSLYYSYDRGDNMSVAHPDGIADARSAGYVRVGYQGYVYVTQQPGTVPLYQYWHPGREDNFATATPEGIASAESAGYIRIRIEGYVLPPSAF